MGTYCASLLADLFLHSFEADFTADLIIQKEERRSARPNVSFRYVYDVLSLNNPSFGDLIHRMKSKKIDINDTTDTVSQPHMLTYTQRSLVRKNYWPYNRTNAMTFPSMQSTFLLSVATSLQHLPMEFPYHNWKVMPELAINTQTFCIALDFLQ